MTVAKEIHQIQPLTEITLDSVNRLIEEVNQRLFEISKQLHDPPRFVYRGNIDSVDFTESTLTADGAWHTLDLSSIITDDNPFLVVVNLHIHDNASGETLEVRPYGYDGTYNRLQVHTQVTTLENDGEGVLPIDYRKRIDYKITNATIDHIEIVIRGWWVV